MTSKYRKWWPALIVMAFIGVMLNGVAQAQNKPQTKTPAVTATPQQADTGALSNPADLQPGETININTATAEEIARVPNIGPTLAKAIVNWRTQKCAGMGDNCVAFSKVEDLDQVPNIGPRRLAQLARYVTTEEITQQPKQPKRQQ